MNNPKKVLILNWTLRIGGVERKIADLANYLTETGNPGEHKFYLILMETPPNSPAESTFFHQVSESEIEIFYLPRPRLGKRQLDFPPSLYIFWKVLSIRPDICLGFLRKLGLLAVVIKKLLVWRDLRVVISEDTYSSRNLADEVPSKPYACAVRCLMKWLYPRADLMISPSEAAKRDLINNFRVPASKIAVLKNWVSTPRLHRTDREDYHVVFVGRLEPVKDVSFLLRALSDTAKNYSGLRACIIGDGSEMAKLQNLVRTLFLTDVVDFLGYRDDVEAFLQRGQVFCITSTYEGLPLAVLEAMAHSLPVVARSFEGASELTRNGETGYVCDSVKEFSTRVQQLLKDKTLREKMGAEARSRVTREHSTANIGKLLNLLTGSPSQHLDEDGISTVSGVGHPDL